MTANMPSIILDPEEIIANADVLKNQELLPLDLTNEIQKTQNESRSADPSKDRLEPPEPENKTSTVAGEQKRKPSQRKQLCIEIPSHTLTSIRQRFAETGKNQRIIVLEALRDAGFDVRSEDLLDRRRHSNTNTGDS